MSYDEKHKIELKQKMKHPGGESKVKFHKFFIILSKATECANIMKYLDRI